MAKPSSKKELLAQEVSKLVGAGRAVQLDTVDFSDPNRPKTCLEVDFPILNINRIASIEGSSGSTRKPIYQVMKWWARRNSTIFRAILLAAVTKAPNDLGQTSKYLWESYYCNHQKSQYLSKLKIADIFMGGGTTLVEGARLGINMVGNDLNPVAWLVVKNSLAKVEAAEVINLLDDIELEIKPQIMPYFSCDCPRGHQGKWLKFDKTSVPIKPVYSDSLFGKPTTEEIKSFKSSVASYEGWVKWYQSHGYTFEEMDEKFDPLDISREERPYYRYWGPEIIYTFWAKHAPCQVTGCSHYTPIIGKPVIATKEISINSWINQKCQFCGEIFDIDEKDPRIAPDAPLVISINEKSFTRIDENGKISCPHCGQVSRVTKIMGKTQNKKVILTLIIHPEWLKGCEGTDCDGNSLGGSASDSPESTIRWSEKRASTLNFLEVRGELPDEITCPTTGVVIKTGKDGGTVPQKSAFACQSSTCGRVQDVMEAIRESGKTGPTAAYAVHGYCPICDQKGYPYGGRFFSKPSVKAYKVAIEEWEELKNTELNNYWPKSPIPYGFMTGMNNGDIRLGHGYTHWWTMFNSRQLLILARLLKSIDTKEKYQLEAREYVLGAFQQYLRNQNMFTIWNLQADQLEPHFSNNNYHPKAAVVENGVYSPIGRGIWTSCCEGILEALEWANHPKELISNNYLEQINNKYKGVFSGKSQWVLCDDRISLSPAITCQSSTDLPDLETESCDCVITDPPFGGLLHYSELSDFFYVWLRLVLKDRYPHCFSPEYTPKALEAVANKAREEDPEEFYQRVLTQCWREANRILKPGGILSFTFHHSEDAPWVSVLESLFDAGFYLEATYPIRSDETKGEGSKPGTFGSQKVEYDIIHVCRKRTQDQKPVSWARMRREVLADVQQIQAMLENHLQQGVPAADLQVIRRGKALEYFSRHYGKVYVDDERTISVKEALVGIHQILDDSAAPMANPPPGNAEPATRQFLQIFYGKTEVPRDQMQKYLRGSGMTPDEFVDRNWCSEKSKVFYLTAPLDFARSWSGRHRRNITYDLDQALLLIGACVDGSGINASDTLKNENFKPHRALKGLLEWFAQAGPTPPIRTASARALTLFNSWAASQTNRNEQMAFLFDEVDV